MRLIVSRKPLQRLLRGLQFGLFAAAFGMLGWCGFVLLDAWSFQKSQVRQLDRLIVERIASPVPPLNLPPVARGGLIGRIEIPRLGLSVIVMEGTGTATLRRAVGHIAGTALPGQSGNVAISGHRDTFFRPLRNIRENDVVTIATPFGEYRYRVVSTAIVSPSDVAVLQSGATQTLTLVTCYPFYFVGAAPRRFIVRAERIQPTA
jgi:sortase A